MQELEEAAHRGQLAPDGDRGKFFAIESGQPFAQQQEIDGLGRRRRELRRREILRELPQVARVRLDGMRRRAAALQLLAGTVDLRGERQTSGRLRPAQRLAFGSSASSARRQTSAWRAFLSRRSWWRVSSSSCGSRSKVMLAGW